MAQTGAPDSDYEEAEKLFSPKELMELIFAIVAINGWNRLAVGLRAEVGNYVSHMKPA